MADFKIHKVVSQLPAILESDSVYAVRVGTGFDLYITNSAGIPTAIPLNGIDLDAVVGSTDLLGQQLLAGSGQPAKTTLAVPYSFHQTTEGPSPDNKVQLTSLGTGNVVFVYASGADFTSGIVQEGPIFLELGEIYIIENVQPGTIITSTEGAYGYAQQRWFNEESPMPLMSLAFAFKDSFFFAFRNSNTYDPGGTSGNQGWVHVINTSLVSTVGIYDPTGALVQGQEVTLQPWEYVRFYTDGNQEYQISATQPVMAAHSANMSTTNPRFWDSRLVMPVTNDGITWPRSGVISALFPGTQAKWYVNDGDDWVANANGIINVGPGAPIGIAGHTGAADADYEPRGATRFLASGLVSAFSGADSAGLEATPMCATNLFSQRLALPMYIENSGDGGNNGIAIASKYEGKARIYQWNPVTGEAELFSFNDPTGTPTTEIDIIRRSGAVVDTEDQLYPASALLSAQGAGGSDPDAYDFTGDFSGGYIETTVPCTVVFNTDQNENGDTTTTYRGTSGAAVVGIHSQDDEQLSFGVTPEECRAELTKADDGLTYLRTLAAGGVETWVVA